MSIISRYEVRLKCIELATTMSSSQDPLDDIFIKADKIYEWINNVGNGNKKQHRSNKQHRYQGHGKQYSRHDNESRDRFYETSDDLFD